MPSANPDTGALLDKNKMIHKRLIWCALALLVILLISPTTSVYAQSGQPAASEKVIVYFFWGDGCPHCEEAKPALQALAQRYPNLEIRAYEVWYQPENQTLYAGMAAAFGFEARYVPLIFVGEQYWEGFSGPILAEIESAVTACTATGCPDAGAGVISTEAALRSVEAGIIDVSSTEDSSEVQSDGFALAIIVMLLMVAALLYTGVYLAIGLGRPKPLRRAQRRQQKPVGKSFWDQVRNPAILALCLVGLGVAGYLAYVETQSVPAVCGPVGECNAVQSSPYARLFGVLPIGVLGVIGYLAILSAWGASKMRSVRFAGYAALAKFVMALVGVLFSLYLSYLEPFVIHAVCMWCVSSAVIMTLLLLLTLSPARQAIQGVFRAQKTSS